VNSPPSKPEVILTNFFAEPTVLLVQITSRDYGNDRIQCVTDIFSSFISEAIVAVVVHGILDLQIPVQSVPRSTIML
jgi:hypothetical protein